MVRAETLGKTLIEMTKDTDSIPSVLKKFLAFVDKRNLTFLLPDVLKYLERYQKDEQSKGRLSIVTARGISEGVRQAIQSYVGADKAEVDVFVDEDLIGGFQAIYDDKLYDASLRTRVNRLRETLSR